MAVANLLQVHRLFANGLNYLKDRQSAGRLSKSVLFPRGAKDLNKLATSPYPGDSVQEVGHPRHCRADARNRAPYAAGAGVGRWWDSDDRVILSTSPVTRFLSVTPVLCAFWYGGGGPFASALSPKTLNPNPVTLHG